MRRPHDENSVLFDLDALMADEPTADPLPFDQTPARAPTMVPLVPLVPIAAPARRSRAVSVLTTIAVVLAGGLALAAAGGVAWSLGTADAPPAEATTRMTVGDRPTQPTAPAPSVDVPVAALEAAVAEPPATEPTPPDAEPDPPAVEPAPRVAPRKRTPRKVAREAKQPTPPPVVEAERSAPGPQPEGVVATVTQTTRKTAADEVDAMLDLLDTARDEPTGDSPAPPTVRHTTVALPEKLTRSQVMGAVKRINPRMRACPGEGRYMTRLRITPAGRVSAVEVSGPDAEARACVERAARQMTFPQFGGDPMSIELPFAL